MNIIESCDHSQVLTRKDLSVTKFTECMAVPGYDWDIERSTTWATDKVIVRFNASIASQHIDTLEDYTFKAPSDWWEAVKERWFPAWALKRWPVCYRVDTINVLALYPQIPVMPGMKTVPIWTLKREA